MAHHGHDEHDIIGPKKLELPANYNIICGVLIAIGAITFGAMMASGMELEAWQGYLIGFWFTLSLGLSGPFFVATQHLSIAGWSASIRRVPEAFGAYIYAAAPLGIVGAIASAHTLYHWTHEPLDEILQKKVGFLNMTGFVGTTIVVFVVWIGLYTLMRRLSLKQDETGDYQLTERLKATSAMFLVAFTIGISLLSWYFIMSLEPHWFSTMFSVYCFAGLFQSGLALTVIITLALMKEGYFGSFVGTQQIHDLGKLLFGFTTFYAYIGFCQFLLIWYANIPEEDIWYIVRLNDGWAGFTLILPFVKFIIPFLVMLPQNIKKNKNNVLLYVAIAILFAQLYEVWYWVAPTHYEGHTPGPAVPFNLLIALGFIGLFGLIVGRALASQNLIPIKDPFLHETLPHHH